MARHISSETRLRFREKQFPLMLLAPAIIVLVLAQIYPTLYSFYMSVNRLRGGNLTWVGLRNYISLLSSRDFADAFGKTLVYAGGYLVLTIVLGLLVALLLNRRVFLTPVYMTLLFIPWILSDVVSGTSWRWMFQQDYGIVQVALNPYIDNLTLLANHITSMIIMIIASTWRNLAFASLIMLGALQTIPNDVREAAAIDGTSALRFFWSFTIPIIKPTLLVLTLLTSIGGINSLGLILATTNGGPGTATTTFSVLLYREAWKYGEFGMASALAVLMFIINMALTVVYFRVLREKE
jgi:ABC-type sugar transport system permease subunit